MVDTRPVPKHECSLDFLDLIPGHAYSLTVQSLSGKLRNGTTGTGRTGRWPSHAWGGVTGDGW